VSDTEKEWLGFLSRVGSDLHTAHALTARNMILDEGVEAGRVESYRSAGCVADHGNAEDEKSEDQIQRWRQTHDAYLRKNVWVARDPRAPLDHFDPADVDSTPETFRYPGRDTTFESTGLHVDLIRVETMGFFVRGGFSEDEIWELADRCLSGDATAEKGLEDRIVQCVRKLESRPVYAGFWSEVADLFGKTPDADVPDWADRLRDRLGLAHLSPKSADQPKRILLFRYPVEVVPRLVGEHDRRPLRVPTVLDGSFSDAFCPAPLEQPTGHVVHLRGEADRDEDGQPRLRREILHPRFPFRAEQLFRRGSVREAVDPNLIPVARGVHLSFCRELAGRPDYALGTDGDLR